MVDGGARMKLVASMVVRNEADRYLGPCLAHLLEFCDEIAILDDGSTDEWNQQMVWWEGVREHEDRVKVLWQPESTFYVNEGVTRQRLLDHTMTLNPTHVLAIDADEFVVDGREVRERISDAGLGSLVMKEVWGAHPVTGLQIRQDGGWREHPVPVIFDVPEDHWTNRQIRRHWKIPERKLACGRIPVHSALRGNRGGNPTIGEILHFGWACEADRDARYQRYVEHDGGEHHAGSHLESIMWADDRVTLTTRDWDGVPFAEDLVRRALQP